MLGTYYLNALFDVLREIHFIYEPQKLWQFVLQKSCATLQAEAGTFFEVLPGNQELRVAASFGIEEKRLQQVTFKWGAGICGWVAEFHQPILVNDVRQDHRFNQSVDAITGFQTKSVLCVPVFSQKTTYGALEILNRHNGIFGAQDQEFMTMLGRQTAIAYQNLQLISEINQTKVWIESLVANLSGGLIAMNAHGIISIMNPSAAHLLGISAINTTGQPAKTLLKAYPWFIEILEKTLVNKTAVSRQETSITLSGQAVRLGYTTIVISDNQSHVLGSGIIFQKLNP